MQKLVVRFIKTARRLGKRRLFQGVSADQVLRQARQAADGYLKGSRAWDRRLGRFAGLAGPFWGAAGALLASGVWCAWLFL